MLTCVYEFNIYNKNSILRSRPIEKVLKFSMGPILIINLREFDATILFDSFTHI
jgi:hypothetical protein